MPRPTPQDIANAAARQEIAARFQREYDQCAAWAGQLFGPGWEPSHRYFLLDKADEDRCRCTGERPVPAATVFAARNAAGHGRHFTVVDGTPVECDSLEAGFGPMLLELHPTRRIEVWGRLVAPHRYSLCWSSIETYQPRSAESLAATRERREAKAVEKEAAAAPLFADLIREQGYQLRGRAK